MKLLTLYKSILKMADHVTTSDNYISRKNDDDPIPAVIKGKRLVLPTQEHLMNANKECIFFHPLSENILQGESEVLEYLRNAMNIRLNNVMCTLAYQLLTIATSPAMHGKLSPDQVLFLSKVKNANAKTLKVVEKLIGAMDQSQKSFVSIYLKRNRPMIHDKQYMRGGIVSFPIYAELTKTMEEKTPPECWGVSMSIKDRDTIIALFEYLIPGIETLGSHNRGSNSEVAPFLDALMKAVLTVAAPLNDLVDLFADQLTDPDDLRFEDSWVETFDNLEVMIPEIRMIPMLGTVEQKVVAEVPKGPAAPVVPIWQQTLQNQQQILQQQPQQQFQQQPQQQQSPVRTADGLDFESVLRSVPGLAQSVGGYGVPQYQNQPQQPQYHAHPSQPPQQYQGYQQPQQYQNQSYQNYNPIGY